MESANCPVCGQSQKHIYLFCQDRLGASQFQLQQCKKCGLVLTDPRPQEKEIREYYDFHSYDPFVSLHKKKNLFGQVYSVIRIFSLRWKYSKIKRYKSSGDLLDFGCGTGEFLSIMEKGSWEIRGFEKDESAAKFARDVLEIDVATGEFTSEIFGSQKFDIVTMWHVLEHLHNVGGYLSLIWQMLKEEGLLLIALPNMTSLDARSFGQHWIAFDVPRHLYHFSPSTLRKLLEENGFEMIDQQQIPLDAFYNVLLSVYEIWNQRSSGRAWSLIFWYTLAALVVLPATLFAGAFFQCGSGMLYYARKKKRNWMKGSSLS